MRYFVRKIHIKKVYLPHYAKQPLPLLSYKVTTFFDRHKSYKDINIIFKRKLTFLSETDDLFVLQTYIRECSYIGYET